ncbi:MAG: DUF1569 domain-containing protein [Acidobacteriota bacterium]|nr:DUF1569 domain-containing protein [Acidobacteriota bacterium]
MATAWDPSFRDSLAARVARLTADARPAWGKLNASGMLAHVNDSYRMAVGDLYVKRKNLPLRYPPLKQFVIYAMPFPKGAPTAPELIARCADASLADEQIVYAALLTRLAAVTTDTKLQDHPAFGRLTHRAYGVLIARHTDHHFRQFGL